MKRYWFKALVFCVLLALGGLANAQHYPLDHWAHFSAWAQAGTATDSIVTGLRPWLPQLQDKALRRAFYGWNRGEIPRTGLHRKLRYQDLVAFRKAGFVFRLNPLLNLETSADRTRDSTYSVNTRGIELKGQLGEHLYFYSSFYENQAYFPEYINNYAIAHKVVPGQGVTKSFGVNYAGHDFAQASGYVGFRPLPKLWAELGHGKHFVGQGYRSLLWSDNASNYPYLRMACRFRDFTYAWVIAELQDFSGKYYSYHHQKHASFFLLTWKPNPKFEISAFQSTVYKTEQAQGRDIPLLWFVPLWGAPVAAYGLDDRHNAALGLDVSIRPFPRLLGYGQFFLDAANNAETDAFAPEYAWQAGLRVLNVLPGSWARMQLQLMAEYNYVRPYTYGHSEVLQAYRHLNQPLAHPAGSGLRETVAGMQLRVRDFSVHLRYIQRLSSADTAAMHFGSSIFIADGNASLPGSGKPGQGLKAHTQYWSAEMSYLINPSYNFYIFAGIRARQYETASSENRGEWVFAGIRTALRNIYYDF